MRRQKAIIVIDVEIEDEVTTQDAADLISQALSRTDETLVVHDLVYYELDKYNESFNEMMDEIKFDFEYGDYRNWK